jgi:ribosomal protein S1
MSWGRVENPHKNFHVGDQLTVLIKDIRDEKIALSLKFPDENPWKEAADRFAVGTIVSGKVARMTDFGAFVELLPGVDALLHVSQISRNHVDKPSDVLSIGEEIEAKVVDFSADDHKISLSMKALETEPALTEEINVPAIDTEEAPAEEAPAEEAPVEEAAAEAPAEEAPAEE